MKIDFEKSLFSVDPPPKGDTGIIGQWALKESKEIAVRVYNHVAHTTGAFDTYRQFRKRFYAPPTTPIKPTGITAEQQRKTNKLSSKNERKIARQIFEQLNQKHYETALQSYQETATNTHWIRSTFDDGLAGYLEYVHTQVSALARSPHMAGLEAALADFSKAERTLPIAESTARLGTFIVGNHGSGKSEIIKHRIWHYLTKPNPRETIFLFDPHGELAPEVARMKPLYKSDRLVYFDPLLMDGFLPGLSILNTKNKHPDNVMFEAEVYGQALEAVSGGEMSENMKSLCKRSAHVILEQDRFSVLDLIDLVEYAPPARGKEAKPYPPALKFAQSRSCNFMVKKFFGGNFIDGNFGQAKNGLSERLGRVLDSPIAQRMFLGAPTIDFPSLVNSGKVVIIRLPKKLGDEVITMIGQIIVAQIQMEIERRDENRLDAYPKVHLMMDEAHHFVSANTAKQIDELRKYGLSLTLATQYCEKFPASILNSVLALGVQIAGVCVHKNLDTMNSSFGFRRSTKPEADESRLLSELPVGNFYYKARNTDATGKAKTIQVARKFRTATTLLFNNPDWKAQNADRFMTDAEWEETKLEQLGKYYRRMEPQTAVETLSSDEEIRSITVDEIEGEFATLQPTLGYE